MRVCGRNVVAVVGVAPAGSARPLRLRFGGITYALTIEESVELASRIADIVTELNRLEERNQP